MPLNPAHYASLTFTDNSKEDSSFSIHIGAITAASIAGFLTQFGAFRTATENIVMGTLKSDQWVGDRTKYANVPPTDPNAQRERVFLVDYEGVTSHSVYTVTIPTADYDLVGLFLTDSDQIDLTQTEIAAWITAFEALARTQEGENVNVVAIYGEGRNR
jgi:hypothetical protein